jgi:hypothetical protein
VAGSAATIALISPAPEDDRHRARLNYDLGQATMTIMIAAAGARTCRARTLRQPRRDGR